jgi:hypothetical protein
MHPLYPYPALQEFFAREHSGRGSRLSNRMDVERYRREYERMRYVSSGPELHVRYVVDSQLRAAELAARLREARSGRASEGPITRLRDAIGTMLIEIGVHIRPTPPAPRGRLIIPRAPRTSKSVS